MKTKELNVQTRREHNVLAELLITDKESNEVMRLERFNRGFRVSSIQRKPTKSQLQDLDKIVEEYTLKLLEESSKYDIQYWVTSPESALLDMVEKLPFDKTTSFEKFSRERFRVELNDLATDVALRGVDVLVITDHRVDHDIAMEILQASQSHISLISVAHPFDRLPWKESNHYELGTDKFVSGLTKFINSFRVTSNWFAYFDKRMVVFSGYTFLQLSVDIYANDLNLGHYNISNEFNMELLEEQHQIALHFDGFFDVNEYPGPEKALIKIIDEPSFFVDPLRMNMGDVLPDELYVGGTSSNPLSDKYKLSYNDDNVILSYYGSPYSLFLNFNSTIELPFLGVQYIDKDTDETYNYVTMHPYLLHNLNIKEHVSFLLTEFVRNEELWKFVKYDKFKITGEGMNIDLEGDVMNAVIQVFFTMYTDVPLTEDYKPEITVVGDKIILKGSDSSLEVIIEVVKKSSTKPTIPINKKLH